jgi:hypothetical protein
MKTIASPVPEIETLASVTFVDTYEDDTICTYKAVLMSDGVVVIYYSSLPYVALKYLVSGVWKGGTKLFDTRGDILPLDARIQGEICVLLCNAIERPWRITRVSVTGGVLHLSGRNLWTNEPIAWSFSRPMTLTPLRYDFSRAIYETPAALLLAARMGILEAQRRLVLDFESMTG